MPYGTYDLCASALITGVLRHSNPVVTAVNSAKAGTADKSLQVTATSPTGACP
jgi:hypothetical protein